MKFNNQEVRTTDRDETLRIMYILGRSLTRKYSEAVENQIWEMAEQYNRDHADEIIVEEKWNDDDSDIIGICVEDHYYLFAK